MKMPKIIMISVLALVVAGAAVLAAVFGKKTEENAPKTEFLFSLWDGDVGCEDTREFAVPEYAGTKFVWNNLSVSADGEGLFWGMPVWSVYLADLNGDGKREIISEVSIGSGIVDDRIIAFDFSKKQGYQLENRFYSNFSLFLNNGELWVREKKYGGDEVINERKLALSEMKEYDGTF